MAVASERANVANFPTSVGCENKRGTQKDEKPLLSNNDASRPTEGQEKDLRRDPP